MQGLLAMGWDGMGWAHVFLRDAEIPQLQGLEDGWQQSRARGL